MINIEGIQVLNFYTTKEPNLIGVIFVLILGIFLGVCAIPLLLDNEKLAAISCFIISIAFIYLSIYGFTHRALITHYDVLIDDSVSLVEVYDKYKIEGKDGDIYHMILKDASKYTNDVNNE